MWLLYQTIVTILSFFNQQSFTLSLLELLSDNQIICFVNHNNFQIRTLFITNYLIISKHTKIKRMYFLNPLTKLLRI